MKIPIKTVRDLIYQGLEATAEDWRRDHLGASQIGEECERKIWFSYRWTTNPKHDGRMLRLFRRGHLEEQTIVADLRAAGLKVWDRDPDTGEQFVVQSGPMAGSHADGVILGVPEAPDVLHLLEMKTYNAKRFAELKKGGVQATSPKYWVQLHVYGHGLNVDRWLFIAVCKDTDEIYVERGPVSLTTAKAAAFKAKTIIEAKVPVAAPWKPTDYRCRFCEHSDVCHQGAKPEVNCRTCVFASPRPNGQFRCTRHFTDLDTEAQRAGCDYWKQLEFDEPEDT